ncbi:AraC-type DNA-binding protein [Flavobacterium fryxellicola]|uniref:AraC family transcriptional regulator n=1 Tax=Flavobacterium fryxellicola TaxID=249352 RepID=A0A167YRB6_9FLAO|nr:AraC family transcriptional regulator [Flavobacterium fryxellicola]OAB29702.1 AraC family transcriptional regulator [Flavobacterium fryxellicola]SHN72359.1 AraC-type DNA-binding protein [Flavobacterium fryxellicola]
MKLNYNYDGNIACKRILEDQLDKLKIEYQILGLGQIEINDDLSLESFEKLQLELERYAIHIINNPKIQLIQAIKDAIIEIIYDKDKFPSSTISQYLSEKLKFRYGYITTLFSEYTYTSIENFIIIQKIERAKKLILAEELSLTEISYELNYSSVAYLSTQFKKVTGLTPSMFKRIVDKKRLLSKKKNK